MTKIIINKKYYEFQYLRENLPYLYIINSIEKSFYLVNREYEFIGLNTKSLIELEPEKYKEFDFNKYLFNDSMLRMVKNKDTFKEYLRNLDKLNNILNHFECKNKNLPFEFYYNLVNYSKKWFENESEINLKYAIGESDILREELEPEPETEPEQEPEIKIKKCRIKKNKTQEEPEIKIKKIKNICKT
jgi:hypothetical protein